MATRKTTLMLSEDVIADYKAAAARMGRSLSSVVEEALRRAKREEPKAKPERWSLPLGSQGAYIGKANPLSNAEMIEESERHGPSQEIQ